jgi:molecular chaperone GrpE
MGKGKTIKVKKDDVEQASGVDENNFTGQNGSEKENYEDHQSETHEESVDTVEKIEALENESKANYDKYLRTAAEYENFKKRSAKELEDLRKFANQNLLKDFLSVVDNLERAISTVIESPEENEAVLEGLNMTLKEALRIFEKQGVKPFESSGKPFDPQYHQAMLQEETDTQPENTVLSEFQKGYMIKDRLLRPAMVVVAKAGDNQKKPEVE